MGGAVVLAGVLEVVVLAAGALVEGAVVLTGVLEVVVLAVGALVEGAVVCFAEGALADLIPAKLPIAAEEPIPADQASSGISTPPMLVVPRPNACFV
jgi:hypothetical protein